LPPGYTSFLDSAWLWVDFFFVLSGFIMCYAYNKYFDKGVGWSNYKKYMGARFARVYPLYFITTIWSFIVCVLIVHYATSLDPFMAAIINPKALPACLLLIQSLHIYLTAPLNTPSWSLSAEWWAYMLFPFLVPFFVRLKTAGKLLTTLGMIGFYIVLRYVLGPLEPTFSPAPTINMIASFALLRCLAGFLTGMLLFTFYEHRSGFSIIKSDWFFAVCFFGVLAAMHFGVMDIIIVAFFPLILLSAAYNTTIVKRILDTYVLQRLGDWSFSIYLVHMPIISMLWLYGIKKDPSAFADFSKMVSQKPDYIQGLISLIIVLVLTLILAGLSYRFLEIPARNYFNKVFKTKRRQIDPVPLTPA